jgi:hypothetical protein
VEIWSLQEVNVQSKQEDWKQKMKIRRMRKPMLLGGSTKWEKKHMRLRIFFLKDPKSLERTLQTVSWWTIWKVGFFHAYATYVLSIRVFSYGCVTSFTLVSSLIQESFNSLEIASVEWTNIHLKVVLII